MPDSILIVARHYPPEISGGARRPALLVEGLTRHGVDSAVIAPQSGPGVRWVVPAGGRENIHAAVGIVSNAKHWLLSRFLLPDPEIRWASRVAELNLPRSEFSWVLTTSPPESVHSLGPKLKHKLAARWICDLRDSWLRDPLIPERAESAFRRMSERRLARNWLRQADLVIAPTSAIADEAREYGAKNVKVWAQAVERSEDHSPAEIDHWSLLHTGSFTLSDPARKIDPLLAAFEQACEREPRLRLRLIGRLTRDEEALVRSSGAAEHIEIGGVVEYRDAREAQSKSGALVLVVADGQSAVPGKLSEYRAAGRPIIALGDGPWRDLAGFPASDCTVDEMATVGKLFNEKHVNKFSSIPPDPTQSVRQLLGWIRTVEQE